MTYSFHYVDKIIVMVNRMTDIELSSAPKMVANLADPQGFVAHQGAIYQNGAPVRSFADVLAIPFRWVLVTKPRTFAALGVMAVLVFSLIL